MALVEEVATVIRACRRSYRAKKCQTTLLSDQDV